MFKIYDRIQNIDKIICVEVRVRMECKVTPPPMRRWCCLLVSLPSQNTSLKRAAMVGRNM